MLESELLLILIHLKKYADKKSHNVITTGHLLHFLVSNPISRDYLPTERRIELMALSDYYLEKLYDDIHPELNNISEHTLVTANVSYIARESIKHAKKDQGDCDIKHIFLVLGPHLDVIYSIAQSQEDLHKQMFRLFSDDFLLPNNRETSTSPIPFMRIIKDLQQTGTKRIMRIQKKENAEEENALEKVTSDMILEAKLNHYDPLIGREKELLRIWQILMRRSKGNPLLVGESGVGKTAIVQGLAQSVAQKKAPLLFQNAKILSLDVASLVAGTKYRGSFEKRFKKMVSEIKKMGNVILFIDELHNVIGLGQAGESVLDIGNLLKPLLTHRTLHCIGSTTIDEYNKYLEKDTALLRRFSKVAIDEPTLEHSIQIIEGLAHKYEDFHNVRYSPSALKTAVEATHKLIFHRRLPDKAIDILDETGAIHTLKDIKNRTIQVKHIEETIAKVTNIPPASISQSDRFKLQNLEKHLSKNIFGQQSAIKAVVESSILRKSGCTDPLKPVSSLLFVGPSGVGKTELCKQMAAHMDIPLHRFDMSEYMEPHSVAKLIGSPPGYVGYEEKGKIIMAIEAQPHSLLLFDEVEKAHPDVVNILLQILDYGVLTNSKGKSFNFRESLIILTSNLGSSQKSNFQNLGFSNKTQHNNKLDEAIRQYFKIEFINRIERIIQFKSLPPQLVEKIVIKNIVDLNQRLAPQNITLKISRNVQKWLAVEGFNDELGARPIYRIIQQKIALPLAQHILFNKKDQNHLKVFVGLDKQKKLQWDFEKQSDKKPLQKHKTKALV